MSGTQFRTLLRVIHWIAAIVAATYVYALNDSDGTLLLVQVGAVPLLILTGVALWRQDSVMRLLFRTGAEPESLGR